MIFSFRNSWADLFWAVLTDVHGLTSSGTSSCAADLGHGSFEIVITRTNTDVRTDMKNRVKRKK
jgi:hypothetical protein